MSDHPPRTGLTIYGASLSGNWPGRALVAFLIDLALSLGALFGARPALMAAGRPYDKALLYGIAGLLAVSFVNRVLLQWIFRASVGKAVTGMRVIRPHDAGRPTLFDLVRSWLFSAGYALASEAHVDDDRTWRFTLGEVTREDLREFRVRR